MKIASLAAVSVLALTLSFPAYAAESAAKDNTVMQDVKHGLSKADDKMRAGADDIHAWLFGKTPGAKLEPVLIHRNLTAHGMVGAPIVTTDGKKAGEVKDIIVDKNGKAIMVVVSDGGVLGIGSKVAAFDYDKVVAQQADGKVVMTLSQQMIDRAADFSYDQKDWRTAKVIPAGSASVNELLSGNLVDPNDKKVASVENVYFRNGEASQVIVGFNKTLGVGGSLAALDYDSLKLAPKNDGSNDVNLKLSADQTAQFNNFEKSVTN